MSAFRALGLVAPTLAISLMGCSSSAGDDLAAASSDVKQAKPDACAEEDEGHAHGAQPHFDYEDDGDHGPGAWDEIVDEHGKLAFPACEEGTGQQSPIALPAPQTGNDVDTAEFELDSNLGWARTAKVATLINNGHTWQANIDKSSRNVLTDDATEYTLAQFHFHAPSEHTIAGTTYPLEVHFVHTADGVAPLAPESSDARAKPFAEVIAVMFEEAPEDNPQLAGMWPDGHSPNRFSACKQAGPTKFAADLDIRAMLPDDRTYFRYDGSLTTPPCSRKVRFRVLSTPIKASRTQIEKLRTTFHDDNSRPLQGVLDETTITLHEAR